MSTRYATIIPGDDGSEIVSNIAQIEGAAPLVSFGKVEKVADGVLIGMVRGGPVSAVGGFGFPEGTASAGERGVGVARAEPKEKPSRATKQADEAPPKTATDVLAMADGNFMAFKSAAKKLLGDGTPDNKAEIVAALEDLATKPQ